MLNIKYFVAILVRLIVGALDTIEAVESQVMERLPLFMPSVSWNWAKA
jgi:hypothetical protein